MINIMDTNILNKQLYDDIIKSHTSETYLMLENIGILYSQSYYPIKRVVFTYTENRRIENHVDLAVLLRIFVPKELVAVDYGIIVTDKT